MRKILAMLLSPSLLAIVVLFGLLFLQSAFYFLGLSWDRSATLTFYSVSALWALACVWVLWRTLQRFNWIDACVLSFVSVVVFSLITSRLNSGTDYRLWGYLIFMVVVPYVSGRCIGKPAELHELRKIISIAGLLILPMLLVDRLLMNTTERGRFPFFGMDHSPLLIGALLSATLICLHSWLLSPGIAGRERSHLLNIAGYAMLCLSTVCLIWVSARGWLLAGIVGSLTVTLAAKHVSYSKRIAVQLIIFLAAALSMKALPILDSNFGAVYSIVGGLLTKERYFEFGESTPVLGESTPVLGESTPVLGEESCLPFDKGNDSIAMRWVLYQEAVVIFLQKPLFGVGAGAFGWYSCTGHTGFPHSTTLQVVSELGVLGGGIFVVLIVLTGSALTRRMRGAQGVHVSVSTTFLAPLFVSVFVADQIYGNFFMAAAFWLLTGIAANMPVEQGLTDKANV